MPFTQQQLAAITQHYSGYSAAAPGNLTPGAGQTLQTQTANYHRIRRDLHNLHFPKEPEDVIEAAGIAGTAIGQPIELPGQTLDFFGQTHSVKNFTPWNNEDSAFFDAKLNPGGGYLKIYMRVRYKFPAAWWNNAKEKKFRRRVAKMVTDTWSGQYLLKIRGNTNNKVASVSVTVSVVESDTDYYHTIDVQRRSAGQSLVKGDRCKFFADAVKYKPRGLAMKIGYLATFKAKGPAHAIFKAAKEHTRQSVGRTVEINRAMQGQVETYTFRRPQDVQEIVAAMQENAEVWPIIPLKLKGYSIGSEPPSAALGRANFLRDQLKQAGAPATTYRVTTGGVRRNEVHGCVEVLADPKNSGYLTQENNFPIAAHEFGHMMGLADEYNPENNPRTGMNPGSTDHARLYNIPIPPFHKNTSSIMSQGDKVLPFHYTMFHKTVLEMARKFADTYPAAKNTRPDVQIVPAASDDDTQDSTSISELLSESEED